MIRIIGIVVAIVCILAALGLALSMALRTGIESEERTSQSSKDSVPENNQKPVPSTSPTPTFMRLQARDGGTVMVRDIRVGQGVVKSELYAEEGPRYVFFYEPPVNGSGGYQLLYLEKEERFEIILFGEPLRETRVRATEQLLSSLAIDTQNACQLNTSVIAADYVRPSLFETELGLHGCINSLDL